MADLAELYKGYDEKQLEEAISTSDRPAIVKYLRKLSDHLSPDIVNKLADYLDPAITNPPGKRGRKKIKRLFIEQHIRASYVIGFYYQLCENREMALGYLHRDEEAFQIVENSDICDAGGAYAPQWKHPLSKGIRDAYQLPSDNDIQDFTCKEFGICSRVFDDFRKIFRETYRK